MVSGRSPPPKLSPVKELPGFGGISSPLRARRPSHVASDAEVEIPRHKSHARARSAVVSGSIAVDSAKSRPDDQQMRELRIMNDFFKETNKREKLADEIEELKADMERMEKAKAKEIKKAVEKAKTELSTQLEDLRAQHTNEVDALKKKAASTGADNDATSKLKKQHEKQVAALQAEIETLKSKSHQLGGVESKIADVEAALEESRSTASQSERGLREKITKESEDKKELAKTIQDLKDEIDRAQKQLDEEGAKQKKEKEAALVITEGLRKELEELKKSSRLQKDDLSAKADKATKLSQELREKLKASEERSATTLKSEREALQKQLDEANKAVKDGVSSSTTARKKCDADLRSARESAAKAEAALQSSIDALTKKHKIAEDNAAKLQEELSALHASTKSDNEKSSADSASSANLIRELQETVSKLTKDGTAGNDLTTKLRKESSAPQASNSDQTAKQEANLKEMTAMTEKLQKELKQYEDLSQQLKRDKDNLVASSKTTEDSLKQEKEALKKQVSELESKQSNGHDEKDQQIAELKARNTELEKEAENSTKSSSEQVQSVQKELDKMREQFEAASEFKEESSRFADETAALKTELETLRQKGLSDSSESKKLVEKLSSQIKELEASAEKSRSDLAQAVDGKDEELRALKSELEQSRQQASNDLSKAVEEKSTLQRSLEDLHSDREKLESNHAAAIQKAIDDLTDNHSKAAKEKSEELEAIRSSFEELQAASSKSAEIERSNAELEQKVSTLETELSGLQKSMDELTTSYETSRQQVTDELTGKHSDSLTSKDEEISLLKSSLAEAEISSARSSELAQSKSELEKEIGELRHKFEDLQSAHTKALHDLEEDLQAKATRDIESAHSSHDEEISNLKASHEKQLDSALKSVQFDNEALKSQTQSLRDQIDLILASHAKDTSSSADSHSAELQSLKDALAAAQEEVAEATSKMSDDHAEQIKDLQHQQEQQLEEQRQKHENDLTSRIESEIQSVTNKLQERHATELSSVTTDAAQESQSLQEQISLLRSQLDVATGQQSERISSLKAEHDSRLQTLTAQHAAELKTLNDQLLRSASEPVAPHDLVAALTARVAELETELAKAREEHREAVLRQQRSPLGALDRNTGEGKQSHGRSGSAKIVTDGGSGDVFTSTEEGEGGEKTVEGTLASIQEQVRALEMLNDQIGAESRRWRGSVGAKSGE